MQLHLSKRVSTAIFCGLALFIVLFFLLYQFYKYEIKRDEPFVEIKANNAYKSTLRVVTDKDYNPFSYINKSGDYSGLDVELINDVANKLNMNLDLRLLDWTEAKSEFYNGNAQIILNMETDYVTQDNNMIATIPTAEKQYVVYGRETISSVAELSNKKIASLHALPEIGLDRNITYLTSYEQIFRALRNGEYDFAVCPVQVGSYFLEKLNITDIHPSYAVSHIYGAMALRPEDYELRDKINDIIKDLWLNGTIERLNTKWVRHHYDNWTFFEYINRHPWIWPLLFLFLLSAALTAMYVRSTRRETAAKEEYARQSRYVQTIETQRKQLIDANERSERRTMEISEALISVLGARDPNLNGHCKHVQNLTMLLYRHLPEELQNSINGSELSYAALFHDVGKMGIPESILNKPGKLDDNEWEIMKKHPYISTTILSSVSSFKTIEKWVLYHHERMDGNGYYKTKPDLIPFASKIIAVADTYSAITMRRSYKDPKSHEQAIKILQEVKGKQLDTELVDIFSNIPIEEFLACIPDNLDII